jgi:hypothetical protein
VVGLAPVVVVASLLPVLVLALETIVVSETAGVVQASVNSETRPCSEMRVMGIELRMMARARGAKETATNVGRWAGGTRLHLWTCTGGR